MSSVSYPRSIRLLLVEDSPSDTWLVREAVKESRLPIEITLARDGVEATEFLRRVENGAAAWPDLVLLDLNLPRRNGREVLAEVRASPRLKSIPIVVLSSSQAEEDARQAYALDARSFVTKPSSLADYVEMVRGVEQFWLCGQELRQMA